MIETERLLVRPFADEDAEALFAFWGDPVNERFLGWSPPQSIADMKERMNHGRPWCVWERETGELIGDCEVFFADEHDAWELAYGFRRDRWGRGYATEAAHACVRHAFEVMKLDRLVADVDPANAASVRVLEKCGFEQVGGEPPKLLYALERER